MSLWYKDKSTKVDDKAVLWSTLKLRAPVVKRDDEGGNSKVNPARKGLLDLTDGEVDVGKGDSYIQAEEKAEKTDNVRLLELFCMILMLYTCFAYPIALIYYGIDYPGIELFMICSDIFIGVVLVIDAIFDAQYKRRANQSVGWISRTGTLVTVIPWGSVFVLAGASNATKTIGFLLVLVNLPHMYGRYGDSCVHVLKWYFPRPPAQLMRLFWVTLSVVVIQNVFGGFYYFLGKVASDGNETSWVNVDKLDGSDPSRLENDPMSIEMLQYSRSVYYIYQTLLTIGYGDVAPLGYVGRMFAVFMCFCGTFFMANLIANMSSYMSKMDMSSTRHRACCEVVESVMNDIRVTAQTRELVRGGLMQNWKERRGVTRTMLFNDLPRSVLNRMISSQTHKLRSVPLFRMETNFNLLCFPVAFYAIEHFQKLRFAPNAVIEAPFSIANSLQARKETLIIILAGTAQRSIASRLKNPAHRRTLMGRATSRAGLFAAVQPESSSVVAPAPAVEPVLKKQASHDGAAISSAQSSDDQNPDREKAMEMYPMIASGGDILMSPTFFNCSTFSAPSYTALTACEVMFVRRVDLVKASLIFPEWGMQGVVATLQRDESCAGLDTRVDAVLDKEMKRNSADDIKARKGEMANLHRIEKFKREETKFAKQGRDRLSIRPGSVTDICIDLVTFVFLLWNTVLIPLRLGALSKGLLPTTWVIAILDLVGDLVIVFHQLIKPRMLDSDGIVSKVGGRGARVSQVAVRGADVILARQAALRDRGKRGGEVGAFELDTNIISKVTQAESQAARKRRMEQRREQLSQLAQVCVLSLSFVGFFLFQVSTPTPISDDVNRTLVFLRAPLIVLTLLFFRMIDTIHRQIRIFWSKRRTQRAVAAAARSGAQNAVATGSKTSKDKAHGQQNAHGQSIESKQVSYKLFVAFFIVAHYIACYALLFTEDRDPSARTIGSQYTIGLYFAMITMTTVGYGDISPKNSVDSMAISYMAVIGVLSYSMLISFIGTLLSDSEVSEHSLTHHKECLTQYMFDRAISSETQAKVREYIEYLEINESIIFRRVLGVYRPTMLPSVSRDEIRESCLQLSRLDSSKSAGSDGVLMESSISDLRQAVKSDHRWDSQRSSFADMIRVPMTEAERIYSYCALDSEYLSANERLLLVQTAIGPCLSSSKLLGGVSNDYLMELCSLVKVEFFCPEEVIVSTTFMRCELYMLRRGEVQVRAPGSKVAISKILEGGCFNESGLFLNYEERLAAKEASFSGKSGALSVLDENDGKESSGKGSENLLKKSPVAKADTASNQQPREKETLFPLPQSCHVSNEFSEVWVLPRQAFLQAGSLYPVDREKVLFNYETHFMHTTSVATNNLRRGGKLAKVAGDAGDEGINIRAPSRKIYSVDSRAQTAWNYVVFSALAWNFLMWPLRFSFFSIGGSTVSLTGYAMDYVCDVLYITDIFLRVRHFEFEDAEGIKYDTPEEIPKAYLMSSFGICDMIAALPVDLIGIFILPGPMLIETMCLLRLNKLARSRRFPEHVSSIGSSIKDQSRKNLVIIIKLIIILVCVGHWSGSLFYRSAVQSIANGAQSWADEEHAGFLSLMNETVHFVGSSETWTLHYVTSLYWSITTLLAVGYGDITPKSSFEIGYTMCILIIGGVLYSVIISNLQDIVAQSDLTSILYQEKNDEVTTYFSRRNVPSDLRSKAKQYLLKLWSAQKAVSDDDILSYASTGLRERMILETFRESTFKKAAVVGPSGVWNYMLRDLELISIGANETVFEEGQEARHFYFIGSGSVELMSSDRSRVYSTVDAGNTLGQDGFFRIGLSSQETGYQSTARTLRPSHFARFSLDALVKCLQSNPHLQEPFLFEHAKFCDKPSVLDLTRKNLDNEKLTKMLTSVNGEEFAQPKGLDRFIVYPGRTLYTTYFFCYFAVVICNLAQVPFFVSLYSPVFPEYYAELYASISRSCFISNIILDLFLWVFIVMDMLIVSKILDGVLLKHSSDIRRTYFRRIWGWAELLMALPADYIVLSANPGAEGAFYAWLVRGMRLYWILKLSSFIRVLDAAMDASPKVNIKSGYRHLCILMFWVVIMIHMLSCGHMFIEHWQRREWNAGFYLEYADHLYFVSYTMTTVGYGNIGVSSVLEMIYSMIAMICGAFLCDAGIVATMVSIVEIEDTHISSSNIFREGALLYAERLRLSPVILEDISRYYDFKAQGLDEAGIVKRISPSLVAEMYGYLMNRAMARPHERCAQLLYFNQGMLSTMIAYAKPVIYVSEDILINAGSKVDKLVFVVNGSVKVYLNVAKAGESPTILGREPPLTTVATSPSSPLSPVRGSPSSPLSPVRGTADDQEAGGRGNRVRELEDGCLSGALKAITLRDPGLLLTNREVGDTVKETIVACTICETLVVSEQLFLRIQKLQPSIGGFFRSLKDMLSNAQAVAKFMEYMKQEHASENLEFLIAVAGYRTAKNENIRVKKANDLVEKYISDSAEQQINIPSGVQQEILRTYKEATPTLFDDAYNVILKNTEVDGLRRFKNSQLFKDLVYDLHKQQREKLSEQSK